MQESAQDEILEERLITITCVKRLYRGGKLKFGGVGLVFQLAGGALIKSTQPEKVGPRGSDPKPASEGMLNYDYSAAPGRHCDQ